jgi:hypothetical protein
VNDISSSSLGNLGADVRWRLEFDRAAHGRLPRGKEDCATIIKTRLVCHVSSQRSERRSCVYDAIIFARAATPKSERSAAERETRPSVTIELERKQESTPDLALARPAQRPHVPPHALDVYGLERVEVGNGGILHPLIDTEQHLGGNAADGARDGSYRDRIEIGHCARAREHEHGSSLIGFAQIDEADVAPGYSSGHA